MHKCCVCKKEFRETDQDTCECGGGIVTYIDEYEEAWMDEYDSDGF